MSLGEDNLNDNERRQKAISLPLFGERTEGPMVAVL